MIRLKARFKPDTAIRRELKHAHEERKLALKAQASNEPFPSAPVSNEFPIQAAHTMFGKRLEERGTLFFLDGQPISLDNLMRQTNKARKQLGMMPVGRKREWLE